MISTEKVRDCLGFNKLKISTTVQNYDLMEFFYANTDSVDFFGRNKIFFTAYSNIIKLTGITTNKCFHMLIKDRIKQEEIFLQFENDLRRYIEGVSFGK